MADLNSFISKMNDLEINVDKAISQALFQKLGQNINGLIDKFNVLSFASSNPSWIVPPNTNFIYVIGAGAEAEAALEAESLMTQVELMAAAEAAVALGRCQFLQA